MGFIGEKQLRKMEYKGRVEDYEATEKEYNQEKRKYMLRKATKPVRALQEQFRRSKPTINRNLRSETKFTSGKKKTIKKKILGFI
jgi:hypothetical protein